MKENVKYFLKSSYYNFLGQTQYKVNTAISFFSVLLDILGNIFTYYLIFYKFSTIAGYSIYQVIFMYSIFLCGHGLNLVFSRNLWNFSNYLISGELDKLCVRPRNILLQLLCTSFSINALLYLAGGIFVLVRALDGMTFIYNILTIITLIIIIISAAVIELAITIFFVSFSFWFIKVSAMIYFNVEVLNEFLAYPLDVYNGVLRIIFTFIYPIAFISYYPTLYFFNSSNSNLLLLVITPVVASLLFSCSCKLFFLGIKNYQSIGN